LVVRRCPEASVRTRSSGSVPGLLPMFGLAPALAEAFASVSVLAVTRMSGGCTVAPG
jgi:hypothetical protein